MGRLRGFLWLVAGLAVALLAGIVAYITLSRATDLAGGDESVTPEVSVVVAARAITARSVLGAEDLIVRSVPVETVTDGAISDVAEAEGKLCLVDLYAGEVILAQRLLDPNIISGDGRLALVLDEENVLMAVPARDLMSSVGVLKAGDHVDIMISLELKVDSSLASTGEPQAGQSRASTVGSSEEELITFTVLENIEIAGIVGGPTSSEESESGVVGSATAQRRTASAPDALLLTVSAQDALVLKYALDAEGIQDIVLRAPGIESPFSVEPVDAQYIINRYRIPIGALR